MAAVGGVDGPGGVNTPERNHQRARLADDARRWALWVLLRIRTAEAQTKLALLLGDLGGALFLHRHGWFLLGHFLLCHALSH